MSREIAWANQRWRLESLCAQVDQDLFLRDDPTVSLKSLRAICGRCPVRNNCLDDAIDTGELYYGIRGGMTPAERRRVKAYSQEKQRR